MEEEVSLNIIISSEALYEALVLAIKSGSCHNYYAFQEEELEINRNYPVPNKDIVFLCVHCSKMLKMSVFEENLDDNLRLKKSMCIHQFRMLDEEKVSFKEWMHLSNAGCEVFRDKFFKFLTEEDSQNSYLSLICNSCDLNLNFRVEEQPLCSYLELKVKTSLSKEDFIYYLYSLKRYARGLVGEPEKHVNTENKVFLKIFKNSDNFSILLRTYIGILVQKAGKHLYCEYVNMDVFSLAMKQINCMIFRENCKDLNDLVSSKLHQKFPPLTHISDVLAPGLGPSMPRLFLKNLEATILKKYLEYGREKFLAYLSLGAGILYSDDDLKYHYIRNAEANKAFIPTFLSALEIILKSSSSPDIEELIVIEKSKFHSTPQELQEAYSFFNLNPYENEEKIAETFVSYLMIVSDPYEKNQIIKRAKYIAVFRNSDMLQDISNYGILIENSSPTTALNTTQSSPSLAQTDSNFFLNIPPGIVNVGNTCYINALLQYLFTVKKLRELILNGQIINLCKVSIEEEKIDMSIMNVEGGDVIDSGNKTNITNCGVDIKNNHESEGSDMSAEKNCSVIEANKLEQGNLKFDEFNEIYHTARHNELSITEARLRHALNVFTSLNMLFTELCYSEKPTITPDKRIAEIFLNSGLESGHQHDLNEQKNNVLELISIVCKFATRKLKVDSEKTSQNELDISENTIERLFQGVIRNTTSVSSTDKPAKTCNEIEPFNDIHVDIALTLEDSLKEFLKPSKINPGDNPVTRRMEFVVAPPVLTIHINRVTYDRKQSRFYKKNNWVRFKKDLDLSPYFSQSGSKTPNRTKYTLHCVFSHEGIYHYGHYWVTIYNSKLKEWIEYNDASVKIISESSIFENPSRVNVSAYALVYVHSPEKETFINTSKFL